MNPTSRGTAFKHTPNRDVRVAIDYKALEFGCWFQRLIMDSQQHVKDNEALSEDSAEQEELQKRTGV